MAAVAILNFNKRGTLGRDDDSTSNIRQHATFNRSMFIGTCYVYW